MIREKQDLETAAQLRECRDEAGHPQNYEDIPAPSKARFRNQNKSWNKKVEMAGRVRGRARHGPRARRTLPSIAFS